MVRYTSDIWVEDQEPNSTLISNFEKKDTNS
jgi:hypothetical protein